MIVHYILVTILALSAKSLAEPIRYDGHQVYRVTPNTLEQAEILHQLEDNSEYDFWTRVTGVGIPVDVRVQPQMVPHFKNLVRGADVEVFVEDVQKLIDGEGGNVRKSGGLRALEWEQYHSLDEINGWLRDLAANDSRITLINAGRTYEGRDILGVRVAFKAGNEGNIVFLESNIHAREWISSAVSTWILNELLTSTNASVRALAEKYDWVLFPIFNPDGFVYTSEEDRLWRKTRVPYQNGSCYGADPNRNWEYHFNEGGTSDNPCSETYRGPRPFSEPNTLALAGYIATIGRNLTAYIAFHSYSQVLLIPYGYSTAHLDNYDDLYSLGTAAIRTLESRYGTQYEVGNIVEVLYVASGGSMDWVKGIFGTPITYTYELRDTGRYGFVLPPAQIIPTAEETFDSMLTIFDEWEKLKH